MVHRKTIICFLCSREYFPKSYPFHLKSCIAKQTRRNLECPKCSCQYSKSNIFEHYFKCGQRNKDISQVDGKLDKITIKTREDHMNSRNKRKDTGDDNRLPRRKPSKDYTNELDLYQLINETKSLYNDEKQWKKGDSRATCSICNRKFSPDRIDYHERVCKGRKGKREVFDSKAQRKIGISDIMIKNRSNRNYCTILSKHSVKSSLEKGNAFSSTAYVEDSRVDGASDFYFGGPSCLVPNGEQHSSVEELKAYAMRNTLPKYTSLTGRVLDPWHYNWRQKHKEFQSIVHFRLSKDWTSSVYKNCRRSSQNHIPPLTSTLPSSSLNKERDYLDLRSTIPSHQVRSKESLKQQYANYRSEGSMVRGKQSKTDRTTFTREPLLREKSTKKKLNTNSMINSHSNVSEANNKGKVRHGRRPSSSSAALLNQSQHSLYNKYHDNEDAIKKKTNRDWMTYQSKDLTTPVSSQLSSSTIFIGRNRNTPKHFPKRIKVRPSTSYLLPTNLYSKIK